MGRGIGADGDRLDHLERFRQGQGRGEICAHVVHRGGAGRQALFDGDTNRLGGAGTGLTGLRLGGMSGGAQRRGK